MPASSAIDWPLTLPLPLIGPSMTFNPRNEIHVMESQRIRVRRYFEDYRCFVELEWAFTADEFEEFKTFFEDELCNGQNPFTIVLFDVEDSSLTISTDYGFFEATYQWTYTDGVYNVTATALVEEELGSAIIEEVVDPCAVIIWPDVSDGTGGGNHFECYTAGDYSDTPQFQTRGTGLIVIYHGDSDHGMFGELFELFSDGDLILGSPSTGSKLVVMYYGDAVFGNLNGDSFSDYTDGAFSEGLIGTTTSGLVAYFLG